MLAASFPSFDTMGMNMAPAQQNTAQVAERVMRRIEIGKVSTIVFCAETGY